MYGYILVHSLRLQSIFDLLSCFGPVTRPPKNGRQLVPLYMEEEHDSFSVLENAKLWLER